MMSTRKLDEFCSGWSYMDHSYSQGGGISCSDGREYQSMDEYERDANKPKPAVICPEPTDDFCPECI